MFLKKSSLREKSNFHLSKGLALRETIFGWVVIGQTHQSKSTYQVQVFHCLDTSLQKFWELENVPQVSKHTGDELACEQHYLDTITRVNNGRFFVKLSFKDNGSILGDSLQNAQRRFLRLEKRLKLPEMKQQYTDFINQYLTLSHMEVVPENEIEIKSSESFYLPHHFVTKADSTTTKLRDVFDASAKTTLNSSLNSNLMVGPKLQSDLFDILLRLRFHKFVLSADIAKMYRQVALHKPDRDFHRVFFWRENDKEPIQHFTRVTYGVLLAFILFAHYLS